MKLTTFSAQTIYRIQVKNIRQRSVNNNLFSQLCHFYLHLQQQVIGPHPANDTMDDVKLTVKP